LIRNKRIIQGGVAVILLILIIGFPNQIVSTEYSNSAKSFDSFFLEADDPDLPQRANPGLVYDNESDRIVIFGGWNESGNPNTAKNDTWSYDFNTDTYTRMNPSSSPVGRAEPGMVYDSMRDNVVMFGGMEVFNTQTRRNDTWTYDLNSDTWTEILPLTAPSMRRGHWMAYDSESDMIVMFGGEDGSNLNETWVFNPATNVWQMMNPSIAPPARISVRMAYDSESDRVILFGGHDDGAPIHYFDDTWAYDYNSDTWEDLTDTTHPSARAVPSLAYNSESDRIVLFGGIVSSISATGDTWLFDYNTASWEEQSPTVSPVARGRHAAAYDWESDRVVIYGGVYGGISSVNLVSSGKTWAYETSADNWTRMDQDVPPPPPTTTPPPPDGGFPIEWIVVGGIGIAALILIVFFMKRK
jgi:N-acetylneuraminic acid mutarotase